MSSTANQLSANTSLFAGFTSADLEVLVPAVNRREVKRGDVLASEGEPGGVMFVISTGSIDVRKRLGGAEARLARLHPGEACGEMALLSGGPRTADLVVAEDGVVFEITRHALEQAVAEHPEVAAKLWCNLASALTERLSSTNELLSKSVEANQKLASQTGFRRAFGGT
jgi:CRP-like cAMP-binding protein